MRRHPPVPRTTASPSLPCAAPNPSVPRRRRPLPRSAPSTRAVAASPPNWSRRRASPLGEEHPGAVRSGSRAPHHRLHRRRPCAAAVPRRAPSSFVIAAREGHQWFRLARVVVAVFFPCRMGHPSPCAALRRRSPPRAAAPRSPPAASRRCLACASPGPSDPHPAATARATPPVKPAT
jgi:hypothetical protein